MKKYSLLLVLALVAVAGLAPIANAGTLVNGAAPAGAVYATEIFGTGSDVQVLPKAGTAAVAYVFGIAIAPPETLDITFTLDRGTWGTALTGASLTPAAADGALPTVALFGGGTATDNTVTFRVNITDDIDIGDFFTLSYNVDGLSGLNTAGPVKIAATAKYVPENVLADAAPAALNILTSAAGVTNAVVADPIPAGAVSIDVATHSTKFIGAGAANFAPGTKNMTCLGTVQQTLNAAKQSDGTTNWDVQVGAGGEAQAAVTVSVTGDFNASKGVKLDGVTATGGVWIDFDGSGTYTAGEAGVIAADGLSATWTLTDAQVNNLQLAARRVNMVVDGTTGIANQTPSATINVNYTTGTFDDAKDTASGTLKVLAKNGTTLVSPFFTSGSATTSKFMLTNMGSTDAEFLVKVYPESTGAITATLNPPYDGSATVSVPAGKQLAIPVNDLVTFAGDGSKRASVAFEFLAPGADVQAVYQWCNFHKGIMENIVMNPPH